MSSKTPNLNLNLPNFNTSPWHDELNSNFRSIDAVIVSIFGLTTLLGPYKNSTAVSAGQRYFDENTSFYYEALSDFTTMAFPNTFAEERIAHPARWVPLDASRALDAAANAVASEVAARASQIIAQASAASATTSASAATTSAANASASAANASTAATSASTSAANASTAATSAATSANVSAANADAAAASALQAADNATALLPETIASNTTGNAATATNADLLDGQHGSFYRNASNLNVGVISDAHLPDTITSDITGNAATATNATQLGGIVATNYARTDTAETFNSAITAGGNISGSVLIANGGLIQVRAANPTAANSSFHLNESTGVTQGLMLWQRSDDTIRIRNNSAGVAFDLTGTATGVWRIGSNTIWHAGNDGANSGLDADLLDGLQGAFYQNASNLNAGTINNARLPATITSNTTGNAATATTAVNATNAMPLPSTGTSGTTTVFPVGTTIAVVSGIVSRNASIQPRIDTNTTYDYTVSGTGALLAGSWRVRGACGSSRYSVQRVS